MQAPSQLQYPAPSGSSIMLTGPTPSKGKKSPDLNKKANKNQKLALKENKYYFNNFYLKKNASGSQKKENYSYHSRKGYSKQSQLFVNENKRVSHYVGRKHREGDSNGKRNSNLKGLYAKQFLMFNKSGGNKLLAGINKKRRSQLVDEASDSFLQRIWPQNIHSRKESIYETVSRPQARQKKPNLKLASQSNKMTKEKKMSLNKDRLFIDKRRESVLGKGTDLSKIFLQSGRFKKTNGFGLEKHSPGAIKPRSPKMTSGQSFGKYSLNGFVNSNRFLKNFGKKEKGSMNKRIKGMLLSQKEIWSGCLII